LGSAVGSVGDIADLLTGVSVTALRSTPSGSVRVAAAEARARTAIGVSSGRFSSTRLLQVAQPRPDRQGEFVEAGLPDVDMRGLLHGEGETRPAMLEDRRAHSKARLVVEHVAGEPCLVELLAGESRLHAEPGLAQQAGRIELGDSEDQVVGIAVDQVPPIGHELVLHLVDEAGRTMERDGLLPPDQEAEQPVETKEMVEVGVRHEHLVDAQDASRRQSGDIAEIEQDGAPFEQRFDERRRIAEAAVDEDGMEKRTNLLAASCGAEWRASTYSADTRKGRRVDGGIRADALFRPTPGPPRRLSPGCRAPPAGDRCRRPNRRRRCRGRHP
jgi:hypothetical protein